MNNAGFESGFVDWNTLTGNEPLSNDAFTGTNALQLSTNGSGVDQNFRAVAGETYTLSGYAKTTETEWNGIGLSFFDADWSLLDKSSIPITEETWTEYTLDAIAPTGAVNGVLWAWKEGDNGITVLDDLEVSSSTPTPTPTDGELLSNHSFEFGIAGWASFRGTEIITSDEAIDGNQSLALASNGSGTSQSTVISAGDTYQLSLFAKTNSPGWSGFGLDFLDSNGNKVASDVEQITTSDWSNYQVDYTAPSEAVRANVWAWKGGNEGSTYVDGISFQLIPEPNQSPTITSNGGTDSANLEVVENRTAITNIDATDPEGESEGNGLSFSLEGPDISLVSINSNTGELNFNTAPDFEAPADSNGDNQYNVDVVVTDSQGGSDRQSLSINVTDENETPPDTTPPTASLNASDITTGGASNYTFTVSYSDDSGLDNATLDSDDIQVVRADGLTQPATLVSATNDTATYQITAPGGTWNATDNGIYTIQLLANQVSDINGNTMAPETLGSFEVALTGTDDELGPNLLINGSFEANQIGNDAWQPLNAANVPGWQSVNGELIEHWDSGHSGVISAEGSTHIELDYRDAALDGLYQDIQTEAGQTYQLTFDIRTRGLNPSTDDEAVVVEWNGVKLNDSGFSATTQGEWTTITTNVVGTGGSDRLLLRESNSPGASDGTGPLLDNIRLQAGNSIPPAPLPTPNGTGFSRETLVSGLEDPIAFTYADDGRIFVTEKAGRVKIIEAGQVVSTFIDINEEVNSYWDRGLMGIALDPDFDTNGWVYLSFSVDLEPNNPDRPDFNSAAGGRLIKVKASTTNPNVADLSTRETILDGHQMVSATHAVGDVDFDNDGNLIFSWGDGGFSDTLRLSAQDPDSKQGKFFRVDPVTGEGVPENPFYDAANPDSVRSKVWALGVRNPWRWTIDRPTGDVYFGEVTDGGPEEANIIRANITNPEQQLNFGWPYFEDNNRTSYGTVPNNFVYEDAYVALPHTGGYDAITGGAVYRGTVYPELYDGRYFFANFGQNTLYTADAEGNFSQFGNAGDYSSPTDIQLAPDGSIQYLSLFDGALYRLNYEPSGGETLIPNAEASASVTAGTGPLTVNFSSVGSNSPNGNWLRYEWDFDSDGTIDSTDPNPSFIYNTVGKQTATLTVSDDVGSTDSTAVEVTITNSQPSDGNLAFGKPTFQSSTAESALASRAVDGSTNAVFSNGSVSATALEDKAFWEVDLGAVYDLESVQLLIGNQPLSNYYVLVSDNEFTGGNLSALLEEPDVWNYNNVNEVADQETVTIGQTGRYLRVQLAETGFISLAEVKVFGELI